MARWSASGTALLPASGLLPANVNTLTDPSPAAGLNCYLLVVMGPSTPIGTSDLLCAIPGTKSASGGPRLFTIQLNESNAASFTWVEPLSGGQDGYLLQPSTGTAVTLPATTTTTAYVINGTTCFALVATARGSAMGNSDVLCALPGLARLPPPAPGPYGLGARLSARLGIATINPFTTGRPLLPGFTSGRVDLSPQVPPIGDQGQQGSCTGWAVGYYYKSYQEVVENRWNAADHRFSPSFVYNQCNGGEDGGCVLDDAFRVVRDVGELESSEFPYDQGDYRRQPTADQRQRAAPYRAARFGLISSGGGTPSVDDLRQWVGQGDVAVVAVAVDWNNRGWSTTGIIDVPAPGENTRANHAIAIVGFDDSEQRFKFANSWGTGWGQSGYGYLTYNMARRGSN